MHVERVTTATCIDDPKADKGFTESSIADKGVTDCEVLLYHCVVHIGLRAIYSLGGTSPGRKSRLASVWQFLLQGKGHVWHYCMPLVNIIVKLCLLLPCYVRR